MSIKTSIEWCDSSVSPAPCCTGCELGPHCFARRMNDRFHGHYGFPETFDTPCYYPERMAAALRWSDLTGKKRPGKPWLDGRPRMIFLNDLGDAFAPLMYRGKIASDFRIENHWLYEWLSKIEASPHVWIVLTKWPKRMAAWAKIVGPFPRNLWLGTSVTDQPTADARLPHLLGIDAAVRIVSYEPALGPVDWPKGMDPLGIVWNENIPTGYEGGSPIDLIIAGGETGPDSRPAHPDWFRAARDQCAAAGVKFFLKHVSKLAGRMLDGREHNELPEVTR